MSRACFNMLILEEGLVTKFILPFPPWEEIPEHGEVFTV